MQGQDYTKLIELSKQVAKELKNYHPHMSVVITADYIRVDESVIGVPISACSDMKKEPLRATKEEHMKTIKPHNEWRRFELITEDEKMIAALDSLLDRKQLSREELAIILLSLRVRPGIGEEAFGTELQDTRDSLIGAQ
jgi:hypothetical protein|nr:MAG TPA: hypothetical protein [Caudoviricetes sp.]